MKLYNKKNKEELKEEVLQSNQQRVTISFYKYHSIPNPELFRDHFYILMDSCEVLGRIYIAEEGINAQISVPLVRFVDFEKALESISFLNGIRLNIAVEDNGKSFFVLKIKVRSKIVADGIDEEGFDSSNIGVHLNAKEFNELTAREDTLLIDMRNHYESEVGHFEGAWCPDVDTFREQLPLVVDELKDNKDKTVVMYCTGGIRCEKASAYLKYKGFENVYQLNGGIINYARQVRESGLPNKFKGKNFVFDERLEERITDDVIAQCHQCGDAFDHHTNCKNKGCNLLFIQCPKCSEKFEGCCSEDCREVINWPEEKQKAYRRNVDSGIRIFSKGRFRTETAEGV